MLKGLTNFLRFIDENWTTIMVIISLAIGITKKIKDFMEKSKEEKIAIAKAQVKEIILKFVTEAEVDFEEWNKAGSVKRSQVIQQVYDEYPIFRKIANQKGFIKWIDSLIDGSLANLREIIDLNNVEDNKEIEIVEVEHEQT